MNRSDIISVARLRLGFNNSLDESFFNSTLNFIQRQYEAADGRKPLPWFLLHTTTIPTVNGVRTIDLPTDFLAFDDGIQLTVTYQGKDYWVQRKEYEALQPYLSDSGRPKYFAVVGKQLHIFPKPDGVYTINLTYYRRSATQWGADSTNDWFTEFGPLVTEELIFYMANGTRDEAALRASQVGAERANYLSAVEARRHNLMDYDMGGRDDKAYDNVEEFD